MSFRDRLRFGVRKKFFANCWVNVLPPWTAAPARRLASIARAIPPRRETVMRQEVSVFDREQSLHEQGRNLPKRDENSIFPMRGIDLPDFRRVEPGQGDRTGSVAEEGQPAALEAHFNGALRLLCVPEAKLASQNPKVETIAPVASRTLRVVASMVAGKRELTFEIRRSEPRPGIEFQGAGIDARRQ